MSFFKFFGNKPTIKVDVEMSKPEEPKVETTESNKRNKPKEESEKDIVSKLEVESCPDYGREQQGKEACPESVEPEVKPEGKATVYHLIVLDVSGSMGIIRGKTISVCNECIQTIRHMQEQHPDTEEHFVSIYLFTSCGSRYARMYEPIKSVAELGNDDYCPLGGTPLFDAIGDTLTNLSRKLGIGKLAYVTIITDGEENYSQRYDLAQVRTMITSMKDRGVIFSFIGANIEVDECAKRLGIQNKMSFVQDDEGTEEMWEKEKEAIIASMKRFRESKCDVSFSINENRGNYFNVDNEQQRRGTRNR